MRNLPFTCFHLFQDGHQELFKLTSAQWRMILPLLFILSFFAKHTTTATIAYTFGILPTSLLGESLPRVFVTGLVSLLALSATSWFFGLDLNEKKVVMSRIRR